MIDPTPAQDALLRGIAAGETWRRRTAGSSEPNAQVLRYAMAGLGDARSIEPGGSLMRDLLENNNISYREVSTPTDLIHREQTMLLVFAQSDGRPLAVHRRWGQTIAFDAHTGRCQPLPRDLALKPYAYALYAQLPQPLGSAQQLLGFVLHGTLLPLLLVLFSALVLALFNLCIPLLTAELVQTVLPQGDAALIVSTGLAVLLIALCAVLSQSFCGLATVRLESQLNLRLESALWSHLLRLPLPVLERWSPSDLISRIAAINQMRQLLSNGMVSAGMALVFSLSNLLLMVLYVPELARVAVLFSLASASVMVLLVLQTARLEHPLQEGEARLQAMGLQTVLGLPQIRTSGSEPFVFEQWISRVVTLGSQLRRRDAAAHNLEVLARLLTPLGQVIVLLAMVSLLQQSSAGHDGLGANRLVASFVAFEAAYFAFNSQFSTVAIQIAGSVARLWVLGQRSSVVLFATPESGLNSASLKLDLQGRIDLNNLQVRHDGASEPLLHNVNLSIAEGSYTAITGPSGCGKTTLLRCLLGLIEPEAGVITIDGVDLRQLAIRHYRQQLGVVLQNAPLPNGSIEDVVRAGRQHGREAIWQALELACIANDVARMPMQLETIIGEAGCGISGGQRQRLALARALLGQPKMLLLDEATSALDASTQAAVMQNLATLPLTRIAIAHRNSTLESADQIAVLKQGRISEVGGYAELSRRSGSYLQRQVS